MSWLLFLDESGHDHKQMPYEVRGGIAIRDDRLWPFTRAMRQLEQVVFGCSLHDFQKEIKGSTLLDKKRYRFAAQAATMPDDERRKHARAFLMKGVQKQTPASEEFCAYGQACIEFARGVFELLRDHGAIVMASAIPRGTGKGPHPEYLRKDQVFLMERFYYLLERDRQSGVLIMDGTERSLDRRFVRQMEQYFSNTAIGRHRTQWIVPTPFFVASDMAYPVQAADLVLYCLNWGYRLPTQGMNEPVRQEITDDFADFLRQLQFRGDGYRNGQVFKTFGICFVQNPTGSGRA